VDDLCAKAPQAAELLGTKIIESAGRSGRPEDTIKRPPAQSAAPHHIITPSRKRKLEDCTYQPPKHAKTKMERTDARYSLAENEATHQSTRLARRKLSKVSGIKDDNALPGSAKFTSGGAKEAEYDDSMFSISTVQSNHLQSEGIKTNQSAERIALNVANQQCNHKPSLNLQEPVPPNQATQLELPEPPKPDAPKPSTPTRTKASVIVSPQTEEIQREKIPASLEITRSSPVSMSVAPKDGYTLTDHILEAARIIHGLSKYPNGTPRQMYVTILRALRDSRKDILVSSDWSTGSMWVDILEAGSVENQKVTILNMLEYIGAWEWYNSQVRLVQASNKVLTKKGKPVDHKGAATYLLDRIQQSGKYIKSLGMLTLEDGDATINSLSDAQGTLAERTQKLQRKRLITQLSRGQALSNKLVKKLGLGILFNKNIW
jgi:hypothetical protein